MVLVRRAAPTDDHAPTLNVGRRGSRVVVCAPQGAPSVLRKMFGDLTDNTLCGERGIHEVRKTLELGSAEGVMVVEVLHLLGAVEKHHGWRAPFRVLRIQQP